MDLDMNQLKADLKEIYNAYLINPENENIKNKAGRTYNDYKDSHPVLEPKIAFAIIKLVDIGFDTGVKVSKDEIKEILDNLEK